MAFRDHCVSGFGRKPKPSGGHRKKNSKCHPSLIPGGAKHQKLKFIVKSESVFQTIARNLRAPSMTRPMLVSNGCWVRSLVLALSFDLEHLGSRRRRKRNVERLSGQRANAISGHSVQVTSGRPQDIASRRRQDIASA